MAESGVAVVLSDRMALQALIGVSPGSALAGGGPTTFSMTLPVGFGDCLLIDILVSITGIVTIAADAVLGNHGMQFGIASADGSTREVIGTGRVYRTHDTQVGCAPERIIQPILWRADEVLSMKIPEVDTNASPGATWNVFARVVRTRQESSVGARGSYDPSMK